MLKCETSVLIEGIQIHVSKFNENKMGVYFRGALSLFFWVNVFENIQR